jgi:glycosyltransferase involved in cell wall biosynthesis
MMSNSPTDGELADLASLTLVHSNRDDASNKPVLSVVVCAYKHARYIEQCLCSINSQQSTNLELIVIDDGSPDDTLARCTNFDFHQNLASRIYVKQNRGLVHSLACGLALARGDYVAFIASDDFYTEDGLTSLMTCLRREGGPPPPDVLMCQAMFLGTRADGTMVYREAMQRFFCGNASDRLRIICSEFPKPMLLQATAFKTEFLRGLRPWCDGLELDDWPTFIRVFLAEYNNEAQVTYMPTLVLSRYRLHEAGIHNNYERQLKVTQQVALTLVPTRFRSVCLANVRIDWGTVYVSKGRWLYGCQLCISGLRSSMSKQVVIRLLRRIAQLISAVLKRSFKTKFG